MINDEENDSEWRQSFGIDFFYYMPNIFILLAMFANY